MDEKRRQLDHILQACLGLEVETSLPQAEVVPGESLKLHQRATVRSSIPVRWVRVRFPMIDRELTEPTMLHPSRSHWPATHQFGRHLDVPTLALLGLGATLAPTVSAMAGGRLTNVQGTNCDCAAPPAPVTNTGPEINTNPAL